MSRAKQSVHDTATKNAADLAEAAIDLPHRSHSGNVTQIKV